MEERKGIEMKDFKSCESRANFDVSDYVKGIEKEKEDG